MDNSSTFSDITHLEKHKSYALSPGQVLIVKDRSGYCPYFQVFHDIDLLHLFCALGPVSQYVFFTLVLRISERNIVYTTPKQLAQSIGMKVATVHSCVFVLKKAGFLFKKASNVYLLSPYIIWRGSQASLLKAREEWTLLTKGDRVAYE